MVAVGRQHARQHTTVRWSMGHQGHVVPGLSEASVASQQRSKVRATRPSFTWSTVAGDDAFAVSGNLSGWNMGWGIGG